VNVHAGCAEAAAYQRRGTYSVAAATPPPESAQLPACPLPFGVPPVNASAQPPLPPLPAAAIDTLEM
jgi:hypothetical protein